MKTKIKALWADYSVDVMVSLYLLYQLYLTCAENLYSYVSVWYVLDYSYGFGSRLMIGSLLHLLTGEYIDYSFTYHFVVIMLAVLCILVGVLSGTVYRQCKGSNTKYAVVFLIAFYVASPASPAYLWTAENMGRLDTYIFINSLIIALVFCKVKNNTWKYILMTLLGVFSISIHQVYFFLFFPAFIVMAIEDLWEYKFEKKQMVYSIGSVILVSIVFLFMQFKSGIYYDNLDTLIEDMEKTTNIFVLDLPLEAEYFWTIKDHFFKNQLPELHERVRYGIITICMLLPIWGTYLYIWRNAIKSKNTKIDKLKYRLMLATNLAYVPVFALMTDWGRWFAALFIVGFVNIMVLTKNGDEGITKGLEKLSKLIMTYPIVFVIFILYVATFEKFEGINVMQQVIDFYHKTYYLKELLMGH